MQSSYYRPTHSTFTEHVRLCKRRLRKLSCAQPEWSNFLPSSEILQPLRSFELSVRFLVISRWCDDTGDV